MACISVSLLPTFSCSNAAKESTKQKTPFELPQLGFSYDALAPAIDTRTMKIHHSKHHAGYVKKLNTALDNHSLKGSSLKAICEKVTHKEADISVLNNAGGHYNHSLFWEILKPGNAKKPKGKLAEQIMKDFGSLADFYDKFARAAATVFGSGWAWLLIDASGKLEVTATQNQENPLMRNIVATSGTPILGLDVWEHAYYLNYQNRRSDYIKNFLSLLNWDVVAVNYQNAI